MLSACSGHQGSKSVASKSAVQVKAALPFQSEPISFSPQASAFSLQILHNSDQESGIEILNDLPRFAKILDVVKKEYENTVLLSSGDIYIPGPFFNATRGKGDIRLANIIGYQASTIGNHEFDLGEKSFQRLIKPKKKYMGTQFPLLSANLNFEESVLYKHYTSDLQNAAHLSNKIAPSTLLEVAGEKIGLIGATTESLAEISSPGQVSIQPVAQAVQGQIDRLTALGINKIIVLAHLQQLHLEIALAKKLTGVDVIIGGGSDTLLATPTDRLRKGHSRKGDYPIQLSTADGAPVLLVNTSREYYYLGRLIVDFDSQGVLTGFSKESGVIASDEQMDAKYHAGSMPDQLPVVLKEIKERIILLDGNIVGTTQTFLNGEREKVRTEETNLGNLLADVYLNEALKNKTSVDTENLSGIVAMVNGGGVRASIGDIEPGPLGRRVPPLENTLVNKKDGDISQLDIQNAFRFDNEIVVAKLSVQEFIAWVEYGVANYQIGVTAGRFPQVSGFKFSFDPQRPSGERIKSLVIETTDAPVVLVADYIKKTVPLKNIILATCAFLAEGGDGYPKLTDVLYRVEQHEQALIAARLQEQGPLNLVDTPAAQDERIQNLLFRQDAVLK